MESTTRRGVPAADSVTEFMQVTQSILATAEETCGTEELEPSLERALAILQGNPESRGNFEVCLIDLVNSPREGAVEIVSFLMHTLRWETVRDAIEERIRHPRGDISNLRLHEAMLDSFSDSWRDRDLFARFSGA